MKNTKITLLSIAIIVALPFATNAAQTIVQTQTPAAVGANGTVNMAPTGPYQTATIGEHDDEHIATTAYVKGAYNDTIAAVNKVNNEKQQKMIVHETGETVDPNIISDGEAVTAWQDGMYYENVSDNQILSAKASATIATMVAHDVITDYNVRIYTTWDTNDIDFVELTEL